MELFECFYRDEINRLSQAGKLLSEKNEHLELLSAPSDPDIQRLMEGFSFLVAGLRTKISDDFPELTQNILANTNPFQLRPLPPSSVVRFYPEKEGAFTSAVLIPEGALVSARWQQNDWVAFKTARALRVEPLEITHRHLERGEDTSRISLTFHYTGKSPDWSPGDVTLFLGDDEKTAAQLLLWFEQQLSDVVLHYNQQSHVLQGDLGLLRPSGLESSVLPKPATFQSLQLLTEYFYLPHINDFLSLNFSQALPKLSIDPQAHFTLEFIFEGTLPDLPIEQAFILHCVPVINIQDAEPLPLLLQPEHQRYALRLPENRALYQLQSLYFFDEPSEHEVGRGVKKRFLPVQQLHSGARFSPSGEGELFYHLQTVLSPLDEIKHVVTFFNSKSQLVTKLPCQEAFCQYQSVHLQAEQLAIGEINQCGEAIPAALMVENIVTVSPAYPAVVSSRQHWDLIAQFAFNPTFFNQPEAMKQFLMCFETYREKNRPHSAVLKARIDSIRHAETHSEFILIKGQPWPCMTLNVQLDEQAFQTLGEMYVFACVLYHVFPFCLTENHFLRLNIMNHRAERRWFFPPHRGQRPVM